MRATPIVLFALLLSLIGCSPRTDRSGTGGADSMAAGGGTAAAVQQFVIPVDTIRRRPVKGPARVHDTVIIWVPSALRNTLITHYDARCYQEPKPEDCPIDSDSVRKP